MTAGLTPAIMGKATYRLHPEDVAAYKTIVARMAADGSRTPGCVFFNAAQDAGDPTTFYLFEGWESQEAVEAFHATEGFRTAAGQAMKLKIDDRYGQVFAVSAVEEMTMPS